MLRIKTLIAVSLMGVALSAFAAETVRQLDDMAKPKPVENKVYDAMVGTWQAKDTDMMGKKTNQLTKIRWGLNHQYLIMEVKATEVGKSDIAYEGLGIFGVDSQGKAKTFWFDNWGADAMSTGTGEFGENSLTLTDSNPNFKETRTFEIKGKEMVMHAKGSMTVNGKETPFDVTTTYKKK